MYHGGTNFGRTAGGPFITTSYDYDAPIDEYGLIQEPKFGHLRDLHKSIKLCERALVSADPVVTSLGTYQQAHVCSSKSGECAAFLANFNARSSARVMFNNMHYNLPPWSISILPDCRNVVFNTAKVGVQTSQMNMLPSGSNLLSWETYVEDMSSLGDDSKIITSFGLLDQLDVTRDSSDYLWYITRALFEWWQVAHSHCGFDAMHLFIYGQLAGSARGSRENRRFTYTGKVNLLRGMNKIALLSIAMGLQNNGAHYESWNTGILGPIELNGLKEGKRDLTRQKWSYQFSDLYMDLNVGMKGEAMNLVSPNGISSVEWVQASLASQKKQPLSWYKTHFDAPSGNEPLALDMGSMGKGKVWINGESIGRYWTTYAYGECNKCSYAGTYRPYKCQDGCGQSTQRWYHVPRSWLKPTQNLLVVFEEIGGDASGISLVKRSVSSVCSDVTEWHPILKNWHIESYGQPEELPGHLQRVYSGRGINQGRWNLPEPLKQLHPHIAAVIEDVDIGKVDELVWDGSDDGRMTKKIACNFYRQKGLHSSWAKKEGNAGSKHMFGMCTRSARNRRSFVH